MAVIAGQRFTYSDTVNEAIDISSALDKLKPVDTPLLLRIGRDSTREPVTAVKHEWLEDTVRGTTTNDVGGTFNNTTDPVVVTVTAGDGNTKFRINDILKVEQELVRVTATAANTITVSRAWGGSVNAAHASGILITLLAPAMLQGSDLAGARTTTKSGLFNYTQIFEEEVKVSATMQETDKYTKQNDPEYQIGAQLEVIGVNMERTLLFGRKSQATATLPGSMDGIQPRILTNVYNKASAALTQPMLEDAMEAIWQAGARGSLIVTNSTQQRRINSFLDGYREADYEDEVLGTMVRRYKTNFGTVDILLDRHMPADEIWILDEDKIGFGPLQGRSLSTMKLPPVSKEYDVWQISGEYTSEVRTEAAHARIHSLATTGLF
jgi:hypothetical protein